MFGLQKAKYEHSLLGSMLGFKVKNISKLFTGFEIRGIISRRGRRK
jgi:hypothetical protein